MPGPIAQAGGVAEPSQYAAIAMDEQFTGIWTQRNPLRDADVPYIYRKFYSASRFDSIIDGINREITAELTDKRRPGSPVFNSSTFAGITSYYSWKYIQTGQEIVRLILDCTDGNIYDFTPATIGGTGKQTLFTKSAGSGAASFLGLANGKLYYGDGKQQKKCLAATPWVASTSFTPGTLIAVGNPEAGNLFMALGGMSLSIIGSASDGVHFTIWTNSSTVPENFANLNGVSVGFSGLGAGAALNGLTLTVQVISGALGILQVTHSAASYAATNDSGTATTGNGTTGGSAPAFNTTQYAVTQDSGQQWKCYGSQWQNLGVTAPTIAPSLFSSSGNLKFWIPNELFFSGHLAILDSNGNVQFSNAGPAQTGFTYPNWTPQVAGAKAFTVDGTVTWLNYGPPSSWAPSTAYDGPWDTAASVGVVLDTNGNWQYASTPGTSGATEPTWNATTGGTTTDSGVTWINLGPGVILATGAYQYAFSLHCVDGTVSTASPIWYVPGALAGAARGILPQSYFGVKMLFTPDNQVDQVWLWRTAQGQATLVLEDQYAVDSGISGEVDAQNFLLPDTSTNGNVALDALIPAPINHTADPPPVGLLPLVYRLGRVWGILNNFIYYSAGPDAVTGNGDTQWPPLNVIPLASMPYTLIDGTTTRGPTLFAWTSSGMRAIYGTGTTADPFTGDSTYMARAGIRSRFAVDQAGSTFYAMTANNKLASFDPSGGYLEIGFPIGDQFKNVTTGAGSAATGALYNPATSYVSWYEGDSGDTGLFVADGAVGWFRYSPIAPPESGSLWSPRAAIIGGTSAVQSIETAPGIYSLLIGPPSGTPGPILYRDKSGTVWEDNGSTYPAWDVKGSIQLAQTGEVSEISHIALKSAAVGARPLVSLLIDEIAAGVTVGGITTAWEQIPLNLHHEDPPDLEPSITLYSDRYRALQGGPGGGPRKAPLCHNFQLKIDYGSQAEPDELLYFGVYGATHPERKQQ